MNKKNLIFIVTGIAVIATIITNILITASKNTVINYFLLKYGYNAVNNSLLIFTGITILTGIIIAVKFTLDNKMKLKKIKF